MPSTLPSIFLKSQWIKSKRIKEEPTDVTLVFDDGFLKAHKQ